MEEGEPYATYEALSVGDLPGVGAMFEVHTGRPADLDTFGRWIDSYPCVGAHSSGQLVGFVACCQFAPDVLELATLVVDADHRGLGVATKLVGALERLAADRGFVAVIVAASSLRRTVGARADPEEFYGRLGYDAIYATPDTRIGIKTLRSPG